MHRNNSLLLMPSFDDWTPVFWWVLHTLAAYLPEKPEEPVRRNFEKFLEQFARQLPCHLCGIHMQAHLKDKPVYPFTLTRSLGEQYIYELHESVNKRRGKNPAHSLDQVPLRVPAGQKPAGTVLRSGLLVRRPSPNLLLSHRSDTARFERRLKPVVLGSDWVVIPSLLLRRNSMLGRNLALLQRARTGCCWVL
jgi:hypothetical protein